MDKTVLITGATDGIGRQLALEFALRGWHVVLHGRSRERGEVIQQQIKHLGARATLLLADLAEPTEVRRLAAATREIAPSLDLLINNAGRGSTKGQARSENSQGLESLMAVNALAPYLLSKLLLPAMSTGSRIINVASVGQQANDLNDLNQTQHFDGIQAYCRSKVALIMATVELAKQASTQRVTVNAVHPAHLMPTTMVQALGTPPVATLDDGVLPVMRLALDSDIQDITGQYFHRFEQRPAHEQVYDELARKVVLRWLETYMV